MCRAGSIVTALALAPYRPAQLQLAPRRQDQVKSPILGSGKTSAGDSRQYRTCNLCRAAQPAGVRERIVPRRSGDDIP